MEELQQYLEDPEAEEPAVRRLLKVVSRREV
jgi:hypothetical protein